MTQLNRNDITNLYLYGQLSTPSNLIDANLIRPKDAISDVPVDVNDFMKTGAGRFAVGSQFELVQRFFALPQHVPPGTYTKLQVKDFFGLAFVERSIAWDMQQFNYDDGVNDYLDRVWVYNSMAFQISDDAVFIVEENGEKRIENFAVYPRKNVPENFDFETGNPLTIVANAAVLPRVDPSGIGRKVNIQFSDSSSVPRTIYTKESFFNDFHRSQSWYVNTVVATNRLISSRGEFVNGLFNDGVTKFLDGNKPIIYGTVEDDLYFSAAYVSKFSYPTLYNYKKNGLVMIGGGGSDTIVGHVNNDKLLGGQGKDILRGNGGADTLEGGLGNDTLDGGDGNRDVAVFSDKFENYKYSISDSGIFGLGGKIITFAHNRGTQADGTDTLQNIEFARFSDRTVPLPLKDGPKNTTKSDIYDNNGQLFASASLTLPTFMFDGDADYTLNLSSAQGTQYNFAYIIDVSGSMSGNPLQQAKNAYISLTNSLISSGIADTSRFAVIAFSDSASLNGPISPTQAISTIQGLGAGGGTAFSNALDRAYQFFSGLPEGGTNVVYFLSDGEAGDSFSSNALALQSIADVRAYGIGEYVNLSQLNIVDSDDAVLLSNPSDLSSEFNNSGFSADDIAKIDILVDGIVVETIQSDQLVDSALGLSFSGSIENLSVALDAQNKVTAEVFFTKGTPSAKVDFIVGSGNETYIASLDGGNPAALAVNSLVANTFLADVSINSSAQNSTIASVNTDPFSKIAEGTSGNDLIILGAIDLGANAGAGNDKVVGNNIDNILNGGVGNDSLFGHDGDDQIITGDGSDLVDGGEGVDTVIYENRLSVDSHIQKTGKVITIDNKDTLLNVEFIQFSDTRISTENLVAVPILKGYDVTFVEGDSENTIAQFKLALSFPAPVDIQFSYKTVDGTALAGSDYIATLGQATIAAGKSIATIEVELIGDTEYEPDKIFALSLSELSGATFENNEVEYTLIGNIENEDLLNTPPSTIGIDNTTVTENAPNANIDIFAAFEDAEESDTALTYSIEGNTNNGLFDSVTIDGVTGTLTLDYAANSQGIADLTIRATDSEGEFVDTTFSVSVITASNSKDILLGSNGNDYLDGGNGEDEIFGLGGSDTLIGGSDNDLLQSGEGNDILDGGSGNDFLDGDAGNDTLIGGTGDDTYILDSLNDTIVENALEGTDTVEASIDFSIAGLTNVENLILTSNAVNGTGNSLNNLIEGNAFDNVLDGGAGNDILNGNEGNDTLNGGEGSNTLIGGAGNDSLYGGVDDDTLNGGTGDDRMFGGSGNDTYIVDSPNDTIVENVDVFGFDTVEASVDFSITGFANVEYLILTGSAVSGTGNSQRNGILGNALNNVLDGGEGNDTLIGDLGNDTLIGGAGNDSLNGGTGNDTLISGVGNDYLYGGTDDDILDGGTGNDRMEGGTGNDTYTVDSTNDTIVENVLEGTDTVEAAIDFSIAGLTNVEHLTLTGNAINGTGNFLSNRIIGNVLDNILTGGNGYDILDGGEGNDTLIGGIGDDTYIVDSLGDTIVENASEGFDKIQASIDYSIAGLANVEHLTLTGNAVSGTGNSLNNRIVGTAFDNILTGDAGDDTLDGGTGNDTLVGGTGDDIYVVDSSNDTIVENASSGTDKVEAAVDFSIFLLTNVEHLTLTGNAINGTGNSLNNRLRGNALNNILNGGEGNDTLYGGDLGNDTLIGGHGNDILYGGDPGLGNDTLIGGNGDDTYDIYSIVDTIIEELNAGTDNVWSFVSWTLGENLENLTLFGFNSINGTGNQLDNTITGNAANNILSGGTGYDTLNGDAGEDTLVGGEDSDTLNGGDGNDTLDGGADNDYLYGNAGDDILNGGSGNDYLYGDAGNDTLIGESGNDLLSGGAGNDVLSGGDGDDSYYVDSASDSIFEAANADTDTVNSSVSWTLGDNLEKLILTGNNTVNGIGNALNNTITANNVSNNLFGHDGNDNLTGGVGNDLLDGGTGEDTLVGGSGNDTLIGNFGNDLFTGNAGADIFVLNNSNQGVDSIIDFSSIDDTLHVSAAGFGGGLTAGAAITASQILIGSGAVTATSSSQRFIYNTSTGALFFDGDGNQTAFVTLQIATLSNKPTIGASDIFVTT
ncbi:hypothetical protein NUACC21_48990 [Scytonema sp. NUACC21]